MHTLAMLNITFNNLFQTFKQSRVASKVSKDDHDDVICHTVTNTNTGVGIDIVLKLGWVNERDRISFMALIRLRAVIDMVLSEIFNHF